MSPSQRSLELVPTSQQLNFGAWLRHSPVKVSLEALSSMLCNTLGVRRVHIAYLVEPGELCVAAGWQDGHELAACSYPVRDMACAPAHDAAVNFELTHTGKILPGPDFLGSGMLWAYIGSPIVNLAGKFLGHVCIAHDVAVKGTKDVDLMLSMTADRVADEFSRDSHPGTARSDPRQLDSVLSHLPGMAYRCRNERDWPMEFVSSGCAKLCGYSEAELISGRPHWGELIHPHDRERVWQYVQKALASNGHFEIQYRVRAKDQPEKWVWERGSAVSPFAVDSLIEGFVMDVTDQRIKQADLQQSEESAKAAKIRRQNEELHATIDHSPIGIITFDAQLRIQAANVAIAKMLGYSSRELVGRTVMDITHYDDIDRSVKAFGARFEDKAGHFSMNNRYLHKDGRTIYATVHCALGRNRLGEPEFAVANIEDRGPKLEVEAKLNEQQERLNRLEHLSMLGEITAGIAHEINQPLTAISTYAQACLRFIDASDPKLDRLPDALGKLSLQAHRAAMVVERIRELARQRGSVDEYIDCNELVRSIIDLTAFSISAHSINLKTRLNSNLPPVHADPTQIQQVVQNLMRNAVYSMRMPRPSPGNEITIETDVTPTGDVRIAVADSGCGISQEIADTLFRPFSTNKPSGLGMGLSISRSIATTHGGQLDYVNNKSGGTTFYLTLPPVQEHPIRE